ncbi:MAG: UDP-N-acetylmuramoylalanyl-D-glutamyl-2,6-diaminopimelate--D-alanyl-D-alanine ligase [Rhodospirillales bacterium]|nr:UDP-N-acetylmuramoylalanyl-D-glutamyl-2,6-diaminopimelate--D-alanyl-D-alanine ligase [Rhodospirillales bacterium]
MTDQHVLWRSDDAAAATGGASVAPWTATGVSIDTRSLLPGDLFVALRGPNFDGHDYVMEGFTRGAAAAIVARRPPTVPEGAPLLLVDDTFEALRALARCARGRTAGRICAITGSVGKTGVKEALRAVLAQQGPTAASEGNLNNQWGVPLSLTRMGADEAYGVFEMGMNHAGELKPLSRLARPHVAVITNVEAVHKAHFSSVEAIADAKAEIFEGVEGGAEVPGAAVLNRDNPYFPRLRAAAEGAGIARIVAFGRATDAEVRLVEAAIGADGSRIRASVFGSILDFSIAAPGAHWVMNSLCVLAAADALGADVARAAAGLVQVAAPDGRGRRMIIQLPGGAFKLIDDSYNASPVSMAAAFDVLGRIAPDAAGRRIAVLGDMLELGDDAPSLHAALAEPLRASGIDLVFTAGRDMAHLAAALPATMRGGHAEDSARLVPLVEAAVRPGDVVCVKGSAGSRMGVVVRALRAREADLDVERPRSATPG